MKKTHLIGAGFFLALFFFICNPSFSEERATENAEALFKSGNSYYEKGEYKNAIAEYNKIIATGKTSGAVYYNLANAYFKDGQLGMAMLNYRRGLYLTPRDADLIANYRFAEAMIGRQDIPSTGVWNWRPLRVYSGNFTVNELTRISSAMYILILVVLAAMIIWPGRKKQYFVTVAACLCLAILVNVFVIWHKSGEMDKGGITVAPTVDAMFAPFDTATKFFTLYEGMEVQVLKVKDDWCKVRRSDGKVGWVKSNAVERI